MEEKRKHMRLSISLDATLKFTNGFTVHGKTKDISFSGGFVYMKDIQKIHQNDTFTLQLILDDVESLMTRFQCRIIHLADDGVGFSFINTNAENYQYFVSLMIQKSPHPQELLAELSKNPGLDLTLD